MTFFTRLLCVVFAYLYPAYLSFKALKANETKAITKFLVYWISMAVFNSMEFFGDYLISWLPLYYELKTGVIIFLIFPEGNGALYMYKNYIHPYFIENEQKIDAALQKGQTDFISFVFSSVQRLYITLFAAMNEALQRGNITVPITWNNPNIEESTSQASLNIFNPKDYNQLQNQLQNQNQNQNLLQSQLQNQNLLQSQLQLQNLLQSQNQNQNQNLLQSQLQSQLQNQNLLQSQNQNQNLLQSQLQSQLQNQNQNQSHYMSHTDDKPSPKTPFEFIFDDEWEVTPEKEIENELFKNQLDQSTSQSQMKENEMQTKRILSAPSLPSDVSQIQKRMPKSKKLPSANANEGNLQLNRSVSEQLTRTESKSPEQLKQPTTSWWFW